MKGAFEGFVFLEKWTSKKYNVGLYRIFIDRANGGYLWKKRICQIVRTAPCPQEKKSA
jgi:hypothetical protein